MSDRYERTLDFIKGFYADHGLFPTTREICDGAHLSSTSVAAWHLRALEQRGDIVRLDARKARGYGIVWPDELRLALPPGLAPEQRAAVEARCKLAVLEYMEDQR